MKITSLKISNRPKIYTFCLGTTGTCMHMCAGAQACGDSASRYILWRQQTVGVFISVFVAVTSPGPTQSTPVSLQPSRHFSHDRVSARRGQRTTLLEGYAPHLSGPSDRTEILSRTSLTFSVSSCVRDFHSLVYLGSTEQLQQIFISARYTVSYTPPAVRCIR